MGVADYTDLRVYRLASDSAMEIFELSKSFPNDEKYSLYDQMRRSSRSVCANVAEAWRKRRYQPAFISKLSDADAEAAETQVWLDFASRCGYLPVGRHTALRDHYDHICRQLRTMMDDADRWCSSLDGFHEELGKYFTNAASP
jgi:four helix bundle protein